MFLLSTFSWIISKATEHHSLSNFAMMRCHRIIWVVFFFFINTWIDVESKSSSSGANHGRKLIKDLLKDYEPYERPVASESDVVNVRYGLQILKTYGVCPKTRSIKSNVLQAMSWKDVNLKWNPFYYGNIKDIRLSSKSIWIPDIIPYNTEDYQTVNPHDLKTDVIVDYEGICTWTPPIILKTHCNPSHDPHAQTCQIKIGSWTYTGFKLNITLDEPGADISSFQPSNEWILKDAPATREEVIYPCCPGPYVKITYNLNFKKRGMWEKLFGSKESSTYSGTLDFD